MSSDKLDYETPDEFFKKLHKEFKFTIDLAANRKNHKCKLWLGPGSPWGENFYDALKVSWVGYRGWLNPPYGSELKHWIKKAYEESNQPGTLVVMLIPSRTDTRFWHDYVMNAAEIRYIKGRIKFKGTKTGAPFPSAVVVFGRK